MEIWISADGETVMIAGKVETKDDAIAKAHQQIEDAQDVLNALVSRSRRRRSPTKWTPDIEAEFKKLLVEQKSNAEIATTLGISPGSVAGKRSRLGMPSQHRMSVVMRERWAKMRAVK